MTTKQALRRNVFIEVAPLNSKLLTVYALKVNGELIGNALEGDELLEEIKRHNEAVVYKSNMDNLSKNRKLEKQYRHFN